RRRAARQDSRFLFVLRKLRARLHQPRRQRRRRRDVPDPHLAGEREMKGAIDRRLLIVLAVLAVAVAVRLALYSGDSGPKVVAATDSIPLAEKRLQSLREKAATLPAREALFKQVSAELALREKGVIQAETAPQAQA